MLREISRFHQSRFHSVHCMVNVADGKEPGPLKRFTRSVVKATAETDGKEPDPLKRFTPFPCVCRGSKPRR